MGALVRRLGLSVLDWLSLHPHGNGVAGFFDVVLDDNDIPADVLPCTPVPGRAKRLYCPVGACPHHCSNRVPGWTSLQSMRSHLNMHACGQLADPLPQGWL
eukprot:2866077-Amphidinium_carterae.2